jgi:hypothetical protein
MTSPVEFDEDLESFFSRNDSVEPCSFYPTILEDEFIDESAPNGDFEEDPIEDPMSEFKQFEATKDVIDMCAVDSGVVNLGCTEKGIIIAIRGAIVFQTKDNYNLIKVGPVTKYVSTKNRVNILEEIGSSMGKSDFFVKVDDQTGKKTIKSGSTDLNQFQDRLRNFFERKLQKYAVSHLENGIALFDGSLTTNTWDTPQAYMEKIKDETQSHNNSIVAISKKSTLEVGGINISYALDDTNLAGYRKLKSVDNRSSKNRSLGTIFVCRFGMGGPSFRVDVCPSPATPRCEDRLYAFYSNCRMNLGYPVLLKRAHIHSVFTKSEVLALQVYACKKYGIKLKKPMDLSPIFAPFPKM